MAWSCGIVGLPNAGKSTLFKALTNLDVTIEKYPFSTINPNKAIVSIPDQRLIDLAKASNSATVTAATIEIIDVAGLVEGASRGEGLGNQFLGHLREVDLLIHVLAGFDLMSQENDDPASRLEVVNIELALADLDVITRRKLKTEPKLKSDDSKARFELTFLSHLADQLNSGFALRSLAFSEDEMQLLDELSLLTLKEIIYVYNVKEEMIPSPDLSIFPNGSNVLAICARLEAELAELSNNEKKLYLEEYGMRESLTEKLLENCYNLLNLSTFYTVKGSEARSWVVPSGIKAVKAAGKVHTDMERGFINAEVISWDKLVQEGSLARAREKGLCKTEGRDYQVRDGDVIFFKFRS